jgi:hypothetical protein
MLGTSTQTIRRTVAATATVGLVGLGLTTSPADADGTPSEPGWGTVTGQSTTLQKGCSTYGFSYDISSAPSGKWGLEIFVTDPYGTPVAAPVFVIGSDPIAGPGQFTLCSASFKPGTYTINAKVSVVNDNTDPGPDTPDAGIAGMLTPATFTLVKAPKVKHHQAKKHSKAWKKKHAKGKGKKKR